MSFQVISPVSDRVTSEPWRLFGGIKQPGYGWELRSVHEITDAATIYLFAPAQKISIVAYASYAPLEII